MKKFKKIYIEITNECNLSCSFCHRSKRPKSWMAAEDFTKIIKQCKKITGYVALHVLGEPLLHPHLDVLLADCLKHNLAVNLTTNGTILPKQQSVLLSSKALRQINISLHSAVEMGAGRGLVNYLEGIFNFIQETQRENNPIYICLRLWNLQGEKNQSFASALQNNPVLRKIEEFFGLPMPLANIPTPGHGISLAPNIFLSRNPRFVWPHAPAPDYGNKGFCRGLRDHIAILVDGTVVPCCLDAEGDIALGNMHQMPLDKILSNSRSMAMYEGFSQRRVVEDLCRRCSYRQSFS